MKILQKQQENSANFDIYTPEIITGLKEKIKKQSQEINELEKQVAWFKQQFQLASLRQFGKSSETSTSMNLSMFDEKMMANGEDIETTTNNETITYTRSKKKK